MIAEYHDNYLDEILNYQKELYSLNFKNMTFDEDFYAGIKNWYQSTHNHSRVKSYVLLDDNQVIGFYLFEMLDKSISYLMQMFISKDYRHKKYGKKLMEHYESEAKKMGAIVFALHVSMINEHACYFYQKNGYNIHSIESNRYVMVKKQDK